MELASSDAMAARFALPVSGFSFFSSPGAAVLFFLKKRKKRMGAHKAGGQGRPPLRILSKVQRKIEKRDIFYIQEAIMDKKALRAEIRAKSAR